MVHFKLYVLLSILAAAVAPAVALPTSHTGPPPPYSEHPSSPAAHHDGPQSHPVPGGPSTKPVKSILKNPKTDTVTAQRPGFKSKTLESPPKYSFLDKPAPERRPAKRPASHISVLHVYQD